MATKAPVVFTRSRDQNEMLRSMGEGHSTSAREVSSKDEKSSDRLKIGQVYELPLTEFVRSKYGARVFYLSSNVDSIGTSLEQDGQQQSVLGYVSSATGKVVITEGQTRLESAISKSLPTLKVEIQAEPADHRDEYEKSRLVNIHRSTQTALDDAKRWSEFLKDGTYQDQVELGARLKVEKATVSKTLGIARIPERLLRTMADHESLRGLTIAYTISTIYEKISDPEEASEFAEELIGRIILQKLTREKIEGLIAARVGGQGARKNKPRAQSFTLRLGQAKCVMKVAQNGTSIDISMRNLSAERQEKIRKALEETIANLDQAEIDGTLAQA